MEVLPNRVQVVVRVRPLLPHERDGGEEIALHCPTPTVLQAVVDPAAQTAKQFAFDGVCAPGHDQTAVFEQANMRSLLNRAVEGFNVCVLAYGQTGSGKTYTLLGGRGSPGVIPRAIDYLFARIGETAGHRRTSVRASYAELYNEKLYDLLNVTGEPLRLRSDGTSGVGGGATPPSSRHSEAPPPARASFFAEGQMVVACSSARDVHTVMVEGARNRTVASHALNTESSRSHAILTLYVESSAVAEGGEEGGEGARQSKITFVDLAGSERLKESLSEGVTAGETRAINRSLFVLGQVIAALAGASECREAARSAAAAAAAARGRVGSAGSSTTSNTGTTASPSPASALAAVGVAPSQGPPFRDSKLTKLLADGLGGSAMTLLLACVSPAECFLEESLHTLQYASRARNIETVPVVQMPQKEAALVALRKESENLRAESAFFRSLFELPVGGGPLSEQAVAAVVARMEEGAAAMAAVADAAAAAAAAASPHECSEEGYDGSSLSGSYGAPRAGRSTNTGPQTRTRRRSLSGATLYATASEADASAAAALEGGGRSVSRDEGGGGAGGGEGTTRCHSGASRSSSTAASSTCGGGGVGGGGGTARTHGGRRASSGSGRGLGGSWTAERAFTRSLHESVIDTQQSDLAELTREKDELAQKLVAAKARAAALLSDLSSAKTTIGALQAEIEKGAERQSATVAQAGAALRRMSLSQQTDAAMAAAAAAAAADAAAKTIGGNIIYSGAGGAPAPGSSRVSKNVAAANAALLEECDNLRHENNVLAARLREMALAAVGQER